MITLQQDNHEKISVTINEENLLLQLKKYFKWRKNISLKRLYSLGSSDYDKFIKYLTTH